MPLKESGKTGAGTPGGPPFQAGRYLGVGMTWALSTALFLWLGKLVDGRFGTRPWFTLIGAVVGASAGFYYLYRSLTSGSPGRGEQGKDGEAE